jgi:hypothetical protein
MLHETALSVAIRVWHGSLSADAIERALALTASSKLSAGEAVRANSDQKRRTTFAMFVLLDRRTTTLDAIECAVGCHRSGIDKILEMGCQIDVLVSTYDVDFISLPFSRDFIKLLASLDCSLTLENHAPLPGDRDYGGDSTRRDAEA